MVLLDTCGSDGDTPYLVIAAVLLREDRVARVLSGMEASLSELLLKPNPTYAEVKTNELLSRRVFRRLRDYGRLGASELSAGLARWRSKRLRHESLFGDELAIDAKKRFDYAQRVLELMKSADARVVAVACNKRGPRARGDALGKPYAFLLERIDHALQSCKGRQQHAILVLDDEDISTLQKMTRRMREFFATTSVGYARAKLVVPTPFYVRSCVTPLIALPDLVAYCIAWGWRGATGMTEPAREDLRLMVRDLESLAADCGAYAGDDGALRRRFPIYYLGDLRPKSDQ